MGGGQHCPPGWGRGSHTQDHTQECAGDSGRWGGTRDVLAWGHQTGTHTTTCWGSCTPRDDPGAPTLVRGVSWHSGSS